MGDGPVGEPAVQPSSQAELVAADAVKLSDGRLLFAFIQKGGALAQKQVVLSSKIGWNLGPRFFGDGIDFQTLEMFESSISGIDLTWHNFYFCTGI